MHDNFCNLHNHSCIGSPLDGYGTPDRMTQRAVELNQAALAITDHGSMTAIIPFKQACESYGIKPIIGSELYITPWGKTLEWRRSDGKRTGTAQHLTVLAYNQEGYQNLLKLTELANKLGHFHVPRITYDMLEEYNAGLIVTSGCMASGVCSSLNPETGVKGTDYQRVNKIFDFMLNVFGRDRYFIEIQGHDIEALREINKDLSRINARFGFKYLATNDCHYAYPKDAQGQADVMCVSHGQTRYDPGPFIQGYIDHPGYYMPSYDEMRRKDYGFEVPDDAFTNTLVVADMVEDIKLGYEPDVKQYRFPVMPEYEEDYAGHLKSLVKTGYYERYGGNDEDGKVARRAQYELEVINNLGFASYFLCVYDIKKFCDRKGIPMTVRGSAGGSVVMYCLGITDFCPIEYGLIFERFLNPDRISAPDADLDVDPGRRGEVIQYLIDKYGQNRAMQVVTIGFIKGRQAIRDAARILEHPFNVGSELIDIVTSDDDFIKTSAPLSKVHREVLDVAIGLEGQVRQTGMHAGAVILSDRPLVKDYPIVKAKSKKAISKTLVGINYEEAEAVGGIKIDILGVQALGVLYEAMRVINNRHGTDYKFETIPVDDPVSYDLINSGNLAEIFQLAGHAGRKSTAAIKPQNVFDVMVASSICRPGPNDYEQLYADRMHGRVSIEYKHSDLEPVLKDSQGIMLFQESVMRVSQVIAGFTNGQADILRKSISKKRGFEKIKKLFIAGAKERNHSDEFIEEMWEDMAQFNGYGFNMPHACAYARIAVKQAYLKAKYPIEYYAAALTGRGGNDDRLDDILKEMIQFGIQLLPPRLGRSKANTFSIDDDNNAIRFPYGSVKNVGKAGFYLQDIDYLESLESIDDNHLKLFKKCGTKALETLAMVGAFDHLFDGDRNRALKCIPYLTRGQAPVEQLSIMPEEPKYTKGDFLAAERQFTGLYLSGHPLDEYDVVQPDFSDHEGYERMHGELGLFIGVVKSVKTHRDRKGGLMAFVTIEDRNYAEMNVVVFASVYEHIHKYTNTRINVGEVIKILGEISVRGKDNKYNRISVIASHIIGEQNGK